MRRSKKRVRRAADDKPKIDPRGPSGISEAAIRGAMKAEQEAGPGHERHQEVTGTDQRQLEQDEDQEWRRAGGKSAG